MAAGSVELHAGGGSERKLGHSHTYHSPFLKDDTGGHLRPLMEK